MHALIPAASQRARVDALVHPGVRAVGWVDLLVEIPNPPFGRVRAATSRPSRAASRPRGARDAPLASRSTRSKLDVLSSMGAIVASPEDAPSRRANDAPDDVEDSESDDDDDDDRRGENVSELERRVEAVITRLRRDGPTLVFEKTTQKHRVTAELVSLVPSARAPAIVPRGSVRGLSAPTRSSMDSPAYAASWHQEPLMLRTRRDARGRRRAESPSETQTARKRRLGEPLDAEAVHNAPPASASPTRRWRTRRLAGDDLERRFSAKTSPPEEAALDKHARLLLWAQRVAAEKEDEESDEEGDSAAGAGDGSEPSEADVAVPTREVPRERPEGAVEKGGAWGEDAGDGPAAPGAESESYAGRVRLTVDWRGRTRVRSGHRPRRRRASRFLSSPARRARRSSRASSRCPSASATPPRTRSSAGATTSSRPGRPCTRSASAPTGVWTRARRRRRT